MKGHAPTAGARSRPIISLGFLTAGVLLAWAGWTAEQRSHEAAAAAGWVTHTYEVIDGLQTVLSSLKDAETGQRGFLLVGQESYLEPYTRAVSHIGPEMARLRQLIADNPAQRDLLERLDGISARRLAVLDEGPAARRRGSAGGYEVLATGRGKILMDSARSVVAEMADAERKLLVRRSEQAASLARSTERTILLASALGLVLVLVSAWLANRELRARLAAEEAVRSLNETLEGRVAERTEELECVNEELRVEIEERARAEAAVAGQKEFLRTVVDTNPQLIFLKDRDGRFVLANQAVASLYGTTPEALVGRTDADFNPDAEEVRGFLEADRAVIDGRDARLTLEEQVTDASGGTRWFQTVKVPFKAPDGGWHVLGVSTEITERRLIEERLRHTKNELEALVQAAPLAIVGIDMQGVVLSWYGVAETMFGWSAEEAVGRPLVNVPPDKQEEFRALRGRVLRGDSFIGLETRRIRKDGSTIDVSISTAPLHDKAGNIIGLIAVYQDTTERRLVVEQRQAREAADLANRAKSNFLANMSHELRTPLNAIIGFSELLQDTMAGPLSERQQRYVGNVLGSGRHLLQLVNDILDLAKIEVGRLVLEPTMLDLPSLLLDMQRGVEPLAVAKRQSVSVEVAADLPILTADPGKLRQILYNLLSNAIKFTREGGRLGVRARPAQGRAGGRQVQVDVWDTGIGIAAGDMSRIFLEFEQLDGSYVRQQQGTGLGLALCRRLVEAHGGRLWVESTPNVGSTFSFVLPVVPAGAVAAKSMDGARPASHRGERPLVLVVEDDTTARELLAHYLVENGYSVAYARTAAEAVDLAKRLQPAAISLDILLPDEHGLRVLSKLRSDPDTKSIPVVVVSITDDRDLGLSAGAAAWLVKPVRRQEFIATLDRVLPPDDTSGRRTALVIDDDRAAVELAAGILKSRGFEVVEAYGGSEGLTLAFQHTPGLIVLDLNMPGMSGFTVAHQLRANPRTRQTPILVSTAMDLTQAERAELLRHVQTILPKGGPGGILEALERLGLAPAAPVDTS